MNKNIILASIIFTALVGILLLSSGLTGMIIFDEHTLPICEKDKDCAGEDVCCLFYHEAGGVCSKQEYCTDIALMTSHNDIISEKPMSLARSATNIILGMVLAIGTIFLVYGYVTGFPEDKSSGLPQGKSGKTK